METTPHRDARGSAPDERPTAAVKRCTADADNALLDAAALPQCLEFIKHLRKKYVHSDLDSREIQDTMRRIRSRLKSTAIQLGVIGEFSAGKTTLVNALVGTNLLPMDALQGTTAAVTLIEHASAPVAKAVYAAGQTKTASARTADARALRAFLWAHIAEESTAAKVVRLRVGLPSEFLSRGILIIDTPGLNSLNLRHSAEAVRAVRGHCDVFLVVIPATSPLSESLLRFLVENLEGNLHRCVFVVTKADLLRGSDEVHRVCRSVRDRLVSELGLAFAPAVLACSAEIALAHQMGLDPNQGRARPLSSQQAAEAIDDFARLRDALTAHLGQHRTVTMSDSVLAMVQELLDLLGRVVQNTRKARVELYDAACERATGSAGDILPNSQARALSAVEGARREAVADVERWFRYHKEQAVATVGGVVGSAADVPAAKQAALKAVRHWFETSSAAFDEHISSLQARFSACVRAAIDSVPEASVLLADALGRDVLADATTKSAWRNEWDARLAALETQCCSHVASKCDAIERVAQKGDRLATGGAGAGAVVGWMFGPLGAVVGGVVGGAVVAAFAGKTIVTVQDIVEVTTNEIATAMDALWAAFTGESSRVVDQLMQDLEHDITEARAVCMASEATSRQAREGDRTQLSAQIQAVDESLARLSSFSKTTRAVREKCIERWRETTLAKEGAG